jgi:thiol-disulfide isomerase/thioredoxin
MKNGMVLIVVFFILLSCSTKMNYFLVSGELRNGEGKMIYLKEVSGEGLIHHDSVRIASSGLFQLKGKARDMTFFAISIQPDSVVYLLAANGDDITLAGDAMGLPFTYDVEGSEQSIQIRNLIREQQKTLSQIQALSRVFNDSIRSRRFPEISYRLDNKYQEIVHTHKDYTYRFIEQNLSSLASLMALCQQIGSGHSLLDPEEDYKYYALVDSSLSLCYPDHFTVRDLHRRFGELKQNTKPGDRTDASGELVMSGPQITAPGGDTIFRGWLETGILAPEIALPSPDGDTIPLSSTRGSIVLLDFWASWCGPCRTDNYYLGKAYEKYRDKGFEIYQVSLDRSRDDWLKAIEDDQLDWFHVSDLQYWNSVVTPIYGIWGVPTSYLLDREGRIIARNPRGPNLERTLEDVFYPSAKYLVRGTEGTRVGNIKL